MGNGNGGSGPLDIFDDALIAIFQTYHREILRARAVAVTDEVSMIRGQHLYVEQGGDTGITCRFVDQNGLRSPDSYPLWNGRSIVRPYAGFTLTIPAGLSAGNFILVSSPVPVPTPSNIFSLREIFPAELELTLVGRRLKVGMLALGRIIDRTSALLGIAAVFTGTEVLTAIDAASVESETLTSMLILQTVAVSVHVFSDVAGTLRIQTRQGEAGSFRTVRSQAITANVNQWVQHPCTGTNRWRILYDNGGAAQTVFELQSMYHGPGATGPGFQGSP